MRTGFEDGSKLVPLLRIGWGLTILLRVAQAVQLQRVDELAAARQKFIDAEEMPLGRRDKLGRVHTSEALRR